MPTPTRQNLAHKFHQNWMATHPVDTPNLDDSLTSLNWLQNLNIMNLTNPTPPASPEPEPEHNGELRVDPNSILNVNIHQDLNSGGGGGGPVQVLPPPLFAVRQDTCVDIVDYKNSSRAKPPYSYATLIYMALKESKKNKITLAGIYNWITENFIYFRYADPSWQNSIRHNLSLNKCFQKVPRRKDEPGKGGFWRINPEYGDILANGAFKKRRASARENIAPMIPIKRIKSEPEDYMNINTYTLNSGKTITEDGMSSHTSDWSQMINGGDFSWNAVLHQDIEVGGLKIKTEDIIDDRDPLDSVASPITSLSPPPSEENSDSVLEEFFSSDLSADLESPVDLTNGEPLDLSINGTGIKVPGWWSEGMTRGLLSPTPNSGLNTPISSSPIHEGGTYSHPWSEGKTELDEAIANFDLEIQKMFDFGGMADS